MTLMTKHAIALSTWISALERVVFRVAEKRSSVLVQDLSTISATSPQKRLLRRDSNEILAEIERLQSPVESLTVLLKNSKAIEYFRNYLRTIEAENELECLKEIKALAALDMDHLEMRIRLGQMIWDRFIVSESKERVHNIDSNIVEEWGDILGILHSKLSVIYGNL